MTVNKQDQATFYSELFNQVKRTENLDLYFRDRFGDRKKIKVVGKGKKKEIETSTG